MSMVNINKHRLNQSGFASITIALILVILLSLLTVGFAQLARREQRTALDKQLASQAYYAAESGVNDVLNEIKNFDLASNSSLLANAKTNCVNLPHSNPEINANTGVKYTCVLINLKPDSLVYSGVSPDSDRIVKFSNEGGDGSLSSFTISWSSADGKTTPRGNFNNEKTNVWNSPAALQVSLTPLSDVSRDGLINNTMTVYLYPTGPPSNPVTYPSPTGVKASGGCNNNGCKTTFNITNPAPGNTYLVRILNYYDKSDISIGNARDNVGNSMTFVDAQAQVDVTGKAKNVLKRIQVRLPLHPSVDLPANSLEAQNICKRFGTAPTVAGVNPNGTVFDGLDSSCDLSK